MGQYSDLREYLAELEARGLLVRVRKACNKDTEIHPLVRLQYRGLPQAQRRAFLFEKVVDAQGRLYPCQYVVSCLAASPRMYSVGLSCSPDEISERWERAMLAPIPPRIVDSGPSQEEVHWGESFLDHGGLGEFPVPNSTPGFDAGPYLTSPCWITKDPDTGIRNVGTYRAQIKAPDRTSLFLSTPEQHLALHWRKARDRGRPLEAAVVIGVAPSIAYASVTSVPRDVDELAVAGALNGEPVPLVRCKSVDLEVPATAEIVLEGEVDIEELEPEAPFGEAMGNVGQRELAHIFRVKCITHRTGPILQGFISQFPPSEASMLRRMGSAAVVRKYLVHDCGLDAVTRVTLHESCGAAFYVVVSLLREKSSQTKAVIQALKRRQVAYLGKVFVLVNEDIDAEDADAVNWAICARAQPHRDFTTLVYPAEIPELDFSITPPSDDLTLAQPASPAGLNSSLVVIDATLKWDYPPVSLPARQYMERAKVLWDELGLPQLDLKRPWWGYDLGHWPADYAVDARDACEGREYEVGERSASRRVSLEGTVWASDR